MPANRERYEWREAQAICTAASFLEAASDPGAA